MVNEKLLDMLLTMFITNALGVVIYCGLFSYSFKRRKLFWARLVGALMMIAGITTGIGYGLYYGFTHGIETNLANIEYIRMASNFLSLAMGVGALFLCFKEKPSLIFFATVMGYASNSLGSNVYEMLTEVTHTDSIFFFVYNGYDVLSFILFYITHIAVFFTIFFTCARAFAKTVKVVDKKIGNSIIVWFALFTFIAAGVQGSSVFNSAYNGATLDAVEFTFHGIMAILYITIILTLRFILVWAHTTQEKEAEKAFYDSYKEKTELQEKNMELINLKCHDMKHQLRTLLEGKNMDNEFIEETQKAISIFDSQVKTGNDTLDTLLTQKSLICEAQNIQLTVMLDGAALSFMSVQEINSFFGNAIDNAVEYLTTVDTEKRFIRISSSQNGNIFTIRIENYCENSLTFRKNGLPLTTKENNGYHGFGTKSIKAIAQKYGGDASFVREDDLFIVTAIFML